MGSIALTARGHSRSDYRVDWRDALFASLLFLSLLVPPSRADHGAAASAQSDSVLAWLESEGRFEKFLELLTVAELKESLFQPEGTTLFVPTDEAFTNYSKEALDALRAPEQRSALVEALRFHAASRKWDLAKLGTRVRVESLQGQNLALRWLGGENYSIDSARILEVDHECSNGIVHVIDDVIFPAGNALGAKLQATSSGPATYEIDIDHSSILFRVMHMEVGAMWGCFRKFSGKFVLDEENVGASSISLSVDVNSINTGNQSRDSYLQTGDFFAAEKHPKMTFESTAVTSAGKNRLQVEGSLTCRGVTLPVTFEAQKLGEGRFGPDVYKVGYEAELSFLRSDFGMTFGIPGVAGDEVRLVIAFEGNRPFEETPQKD